MKELIQAKAAAQNIGNDTDKSLSFVSKLVLQKQADLVFAVRAAAEIKTEFAEVDEKRKEFVDPLKEIVKTTDKVIKKIDAFFKPALEGLATCEKLIKKKISAYADDQQQQRDDLLREVESAQTAAERSDLIAKAELHIVEKVSGLQFRSGWEGEVVDASLLPREYLVPDLKTLKALTKAKGGNPNIPGWKAWPKSSDIAITVDKVK